MKSQTIESGDGKTTIINFYIGNEDVSQGSSRLSTIFLWGVITLLVLPFILPIFGWDIGMLKNSLMQLQMSLSLPSVVSTPQPVANIQPTPETPPVIQVSDDKICKIFKLNQITGLRGYSTLVGDGNWETLLANLPTEVCHKHCVMRLREGTQVELFNENKNIRLIGTWLSTGTNCDTDEVPANQREYQHTSLMLIPLAKGYQYAYQKLLEALNPGAEKKTEKPAVVASEWSLLDFIPTTWSWKFLCVVGILIIILTNFTGWFGKSLAVVLIGLLGYALLN